LIRSEDLEVRNILLSAVLGSRAFRIADNFYIEEIDLPQDICGFTENMLYLQASTKKSDYD
jgi:hypothetical protein